jgi:hypothetical protein
MAAGSLPISVCGKTTPILMPAPFDKTIHFLWLKNCNPKLENARQVFQFNQPDDSIAASIRI